METRNKKININENHSQECCGNISSVFLSLSYELTKDSCEGSSSCVVNVQPHTRFVALWRLVCLLQ